jgi:hypothetical protein
MYQGDFPWKANGWNAPGNNRNPSGAVINSTTAPSLVSTGVDFNSNGAIFYDYKLTCDATRTPTNNALYIGELVLPGMLLAPVPSASPTYAPTKSPTKKPSNAPSLSPSNHPTADLPDNGDLVANILEGSTATSFGCVNTQNAGNTVDGTTNKFWCDRGGIAPYNFTTGIHFVNGAGQGLTIPKGIRLYTANGCKGCDPREYILEGRIDANATWEIIDTGDFPGIAGGLGRNSNDGSLIDASTYESADSRYIVSEAQDFHSHSAAFSEYRLTFVRTRSLNQNALHFAEIEIPGMQLPPV